jgi:hypothetical protein
VKGDEEL